MRRPTKIVEELIGTSGKESVENIIAGED